MTAPGAEGLTVLDCGERYRMAKKKPPEPAPSSVTAERAARLYQLVQMLHSSPQTRANLLRRLGLNIRGFYRDLEALRAAGITVALVKSRYSLQGDADEAEARLPFPDPLLTLGEARQLAKGRSRAHQKIKQQLKSVQK